MRNPGPIVTAAWDGSTSLFSVSTRDEVDRLHAVARDAGWSAVREPKEYPRYTERYYASFVEDADGIRIEFMHNPPRESE